MKKPFRYGGECGFSIIILLLLPSIVTATNSTVSGNIRVGADFPVFGAKVQLYDVLETSVVLLQTTYADANGDYEFYPVDNEGGTRPVIVKAYSDSQSGRFSKWVLFPPLLPIPFASEATNIILSSETVPVNFSFTSNTESGRMFKALSHISNASDFLTHYFDNSKDLDGDNNATGQDPWSQPQIPVWNHPQLECGYDTSIGIYGTDKLFGRKIGPFYPHIICQPSLFEEVENIQHEYGHAIISTLYNYKLSDNSAPAEEVCSNTTPLRALDEGFANFFPLIVNRFEGDREFESESCGNAIAQHEGYRYPGPVTNILYDIADDESFTDSSLGEDDDPIHPGQFEQIWQVLRDGNPLDIVQFFTAWENAISRDPKDLDALYEIFRKHGADRLLDYRPNQDSTPKGDMYDAQGAHNPWSTYRHTYARTGSTFLRGNLDAGSIVQGWTYDEAANGTAFLDSPVVADIDGKGDMEIIITASAPTLSGQDRIYALKRQPDKTWKQLWKYPEVYDNVQVDSIWGAPAVGDVIPGGAPEVAFSTSSGQVFLLDANTGRPAKGWWSPFQVPEKPCGGGGNCTGSIQSVSMVDIDDDGHLELVFADMVYATGFASHIYVINASSKYQRYKWFASASGPEGALAFADIDADGKLEIVSPSLTGLFVADDDGDELYRYFNKRTLYDTPAIADLDDNGVSDIIYTTAAEECTTNCEEWTWDNYTYRVDKDGNVLGSYHHTWFANVDPAIGNLDGDTDLEIATGENKNLISNFYDYPWTSPYSGKLVILDTDMTKLCDFTDSNQMDEIYASPVIADIDNDNTSEVIFGTRNGTVYVVSYGGSSTCTLEWKKSLSGSVWSSPVIADVDGDGYAEIIVKHDAIINNPTMVTEAYRQFGHITSGNETLPFNPITGRLYGLFDHKPERPVPEMMREAMMGFRAMTSSSSTLTALDADNQKPELNYIPSIRAIEGDLVNISASATDPDNDTIAYYFTPPFGSNGLWQTTAYNSSGAYEILATASDGSLTDSQFVTLEVFRADATNLTTFNDSSAVVFVFNTVPLVSYHCEPCEVEDKMTSDTFTSLGNQEFLWNNLPETHISFEMEARL